MEHPFPQSISSIEKYKKLLSKVSQEDSLAILINADPDALASALALKRIFYNKVKKAVIYRINVIKRTDNLSMIKLLRINHKDITKLDKSKITKWAIVDSQPHHFTKYKNISFDIIIDHHPVSPNSVGSFVDIQEDYGATSTIMTEYLRAAKTKPSPRLATALFYGIKTDTDNFTRKSTVNDINAFKYLYKYSNLNIIKKIESSMINRKTVKSFQTAIKKLRFFKDKGYIHMGTVKDPDVLVIIADFFLKMAEDNWCIVSGIYGRRLIVIFRNAGFRLNAGKVAQKMFSQLGSAGGHKDTARAEIPIHKIQNEIKFDEKNFETQIENFVWNKISSI